MSFQFYEKILINKNNIMKSIFTICSLVLLSLFLTSCWEEEIKEVEKKNFIIETKNISNFNWDYTLEKTWKIGSDQDITLSSQVNGRISVIYKNEWEYVNRWDIILRIEDNIANYGLGLESAKNNLEKAKLNYESTEVKLDKIISDIRRDLNNSEIDNSSSTSSLELKKIESSIKKLALDYENMKIWNQEQIMWFKNSMNKDLVNFKSYIDNVIDFSDEILWVTNINKNKNDDFENYLWKKDSDQLRSTEKLLIELIDYRKSELSTVSFDFEWTTLFKSNIDKINLGYEKITELLEELDQVLDNSVTSVWSLSKWEISWFKSQITWYEWSFNANNSSFIGLKNAISSFLETYLNSEDSLLKQIELLEQDKRIYIKWLDFKIEVTNATLDEAIINKDLTLKNLDIIITDAEIWYKQSLKQYWKLTVIAPISWTISDILVDEWEEINPGTRLLNVTNNKKWEVEISLTDNELKYVKVWMVVDVIVNNKVEAATITSISKIADSNLNYTTTVSLENNVNLIWNIVVVKIPVIIDNILVPISLIETIWWGKAQIKSLSWTWIENSVISLWKIWGNNIEILPWYDQNLDIITSEIKNFDSNKFNLKLKEKDGE